MIVPMTEFSMLIFYKEYDAFLQHLKTVGVFHVAERNKDEAPEQTQQKLMISDLNDAITFLLAHKTENDSTTDNETECLPPQQRGIAEILKEIRQIKEKSEQEMTDEWKQNVDQYAACIPSLKKRKLELEDAFELSRIKTNTQEACDGKIKILEGFVPRPQKKIFSDFLDKQGIVYIKKRSRFSDNPPILLHNNWFSRLFEPIGSLFSLPSYKDLDLTVFFAPFFALFFGFGMNDMGYGIILFAGATSMRLLGKSKIKKSYLTLVQLLGIITFFFGFLTGNFFGVSVAKFPWLSPLKEFFLKDKQIFTLAIAIGFIQILFGMALQGINKMAKFGFRYGLPQVGWIMIILHLVNMFYFKVWPFYSHIDIYIGLALIIFFADPEAGFFSGIGTGIWELFGITGLMGDLLSYIRLFALGVSSAILALVINSIASQIEKTAYIGPVLFLIIIIFGHSLNLFVASLGAFVHTMRLTFVEFYKNAGFTGGGNPYKPFTIISNQKT
ncbi:MAG: V-type ATP synthase subunit I [Sphingobacteriia bacterium]|nr:V-type ATP synthase subunit I [Sphingobacteriia bacterium]